MIKLIVYYLKFIFHLIASILPLPLLTKWLLQIWSCSVERWSAHHQADFLWKNSVALSHHAPLKIFQFKFKVFGLKFWNVFHLSLIPAARYLSTNVALESFLEEVHQFFGYIWVSKIIPPPPNARSTREDMFVRVRITPSTHNPRLMMLWSTASFVVIACGTVPTQLKV